MTIRIDLDDDGEDDITIAIPALVKYAPLIKLLLVSCGVSVISYILVIA